MSLLKASPAVIRAWAIEGAGLKQGSRETLAGTVARQRAGVGDGLGSACILEAKLKMGGVGVGRRV